MAKRPRVFRRLTYGQSLATIRCGGQLIGCPANIHPNGNSGIAMLMDVEKFRELLNYAREHTLAKGGIDFVECMCGLDNDEEIILRMMKKKYQLSFGEEVRVHFFERDVEKELEIKAYREGR